MLQALSEYSVKATEPVGATVAPWKVAVSPTVIGVPTVIAVGVACVVIDGPALTQVTVAGLAEWAPQNGST